MNEQLNNSSCWNPNFLRNVKKDIYALDLLNNNGI